MLRIGAGLVLLGAATVTVFAAEPAAPTAEDVKLAKLFRDYLDGEFQRHPAFATQQGNHDHRRCARRSLHRGAEEGRRHRPEVARDPVEIDPHQGPQPPGSDRPRNLDARSRIRPVDVRERQPLRIRPAHLRRIHLGQRVPAFHSVDSAAGAERGQRREANRLDSENCGGCKSRLEETAEDHDGNRHPPQPRRHCFLRKGNLRVRGGDAGFGAARIPLPRRREGAPGIPNLPREGIAAALVRRLAARHPQVRREAGTRT